MKTFKNGDKVKIPTIGTASLKTSAAEIRKALFDYKLDYLYVCQVWVDGDIAVMRGDGIELSQDLYHERDLEHYFDQITPELSGLIIDFDKVETIEESAYNYTESIMFSHKSLETAIMAKRFDKCYITGAKSNAARNYWFKIFQEEHGRS
jgi:hypothetical protein